MARLLGIAERAGQLDPQTPAVQSNGVLIGSSLLIAGKLPIHSAIIPCWKSEMANAKKKIGILPPPPPNRLVSVLEDPPRKNVLLLTCMDQRLLDETIRFMNELNLNNRYDQVALAGGAMGVHRLPENPTDPSGTWWAVFTAHLAAAINKLHRPIKDVFLIDHLDCGAYKELHPDERIRNKYAKGSLLKMRELHGDELSALAWRVHEFCEEQYQCTKDEAWEHIRVSCFVVDLRGHVTQLDASVV